MRWTRSPGMRFFVFFVVALATVVVGPLFVSRPAQAQQGPVAPDLSPNLGWLNTDRALRFSEELKGHVVLLDFWTYCCINCMHVLPDLEYLEHKYADRPFVVIGVHSAKFTTEADRRGIRDAVQRYDIAHPVVIDDNHGIWSRFGVRSWPTFVLIGADGRVIGSASGEGHRDLLDTAVARALEEAEQNGTLAAQRVAIHADAMPGVPGGLRFPGKVIGVEPAQADAGWLLVADSSNDRVIAATFPDAHGVSRVRRIVGGTGRGLVDGASGDSRFHDPQGMAFDAARNRVYVADTKNHAIRSIDLETFEVSTLVGRGEQWDDRRGGLSGREQGLASPWDLALSPDGAVLYVAMAGTHQLWSVDLETLVARAIAGTGREDIIDGPAAEAALAQPSGLSLSTDGGTLYFADSEVSAIRALDLEAGEVHTLIGAGLFEFGDVDGPFPDARLQHPLGVASWRAEGGDRLLVADTYNSRIKVLNPEERFVGRWLGSSETAADPRDDLRLREPGGIDIVERGEGGATVLVADTNHHRIVMVDMPGRAWREVLIEGLAAESASPVPNDAIPATVRLLPGAAANVSISPGVASDKRLNPEVPVSIRVRRVTDGRAREVIGQATLGGGQEMRFTIPAEHVSPGSRWLIELGGAMCADDMGVCEPIERTWIVSVEDGPTNASGFGWEP
ncbi:MAG: redoxin family protein [Phycisphaeraceae bacterium]|nr:redoxin family protein [Phycisphaeraceae bacterium]